MEPIIEVNALAERTAKFLRQQYIPVRSVEIGRENIVPRIDIGSNIHIEITFSGTWRVCHMTPKGRIFCYPERYTMQIVLTDVQMLLQNPTLTPGGQEDGD